jgi:hypothetical protein
MIAMAVLAFVYDLKSALGGTFGGDDSCVMHPENAKLLD